MEFDPPQEDVLPTDVLMRWVINRPVIYNPSKSPPIQEKAFHPRPKADDEGLSLSRRQSKTSPHFLTAKQFKSLNKDGKDRLRQTCGVCGVSMTVVQTIGLEAVPDRMPDDPGHILLPLINFHDFEGERHTDETNKRIRLWIAALIQQAEELIQPGTLLEDC